MSLDNIEYIKISPGIGMARVGNSDTDFIGPETPGIPPAPPGGNFKDADGKVLPMSARFRVYGYDIDDNVIMELNLDNPNVKSLEWTVHLANKKAANYAFQGKYGFNSGELRNPTVQPGKHPDDRDQLIIDPGPVMISGTSTPRIALTDNIFDGKINGPIVSTPQNPIQIPTSNLLGHYGETGMTDVTYNPMPVTIGYLRTDDCGRLVIVGGRGDAGSLTTPSTIIQKGPGYYNGTEPKAERLNQDPNSNGNLYFNNPGWYDDTAGGSVNATVIFNTSKGPRTKSSQGTDTFSNRPAVNEENKRAWVAVAPPKFAPSMKNVVSLADLQYNIFPEKDPNAGSLVIGTIGSDNGPSATPVGVTSNGIFNLLDSTSGTHFASNRITPAGENPRHSPALTTFRNSIYCAYNAEPVAFSSVLTLGKSDSPTGTFSFFQQSTDVQSDVGPALTVFNDKIYCAVVANGNSSAQFQNKVILGSTTGTQLTFNPLTFKLATPTGYQDFNDIPTQPVAISAYNGLLYIALSVNGDNYLGVLSNSVAFQCNLQRIGQTSIVNNLSPSIAPYDGRLYYAITDSTNTVQYGSLDLNGPQKPLNPTIPSNPNIPADPTPAFNITFKPVDGAVESQISPAISGFNGKLYCAVVDINGGNKAVVLYTKTPLVHINNNGSVEEQEPPFAFDDRLNSDNVQVALIDFQVVDFYQDILPVLSTVTDYAYVNELAFDGHGPKTQANFVRSTYETSLGTPDSPNAGTRNHVFQFIRPGEWVTNVPPPPMDFDNSILPGQPSIVPPQENQDGTLMPHLAGTGGSVDENIFNNTQFPGQWLSLTRHQLAKFQKWVNGQFVTGDPLPPPIPVDNRDISEQPDALDLAALELTVGGGFHPGIELTYYMAYPEYFCEPFRFASEIKYNGHTLASVTPGSIAGFMSIPWHGDFWSCNVDFWPPQRPDIVVQDEGGIPTILNWFRSEALQIPDTASSDTKWLHGENPGNFDGNHTTYQTFMKYWAYFGFVTEAVPPVTDPPTTPPVTDEGEIVRVESERNTCLDGPNPPTCPAVNPVVADVAAKALTVDNGRFTLRGKVLRNNAGVQGLLIEAFDHDLLSKDDKLGNSTTDANGMFSIQFNHNDFSRWRLEKRPDIYFKVYKGSDLILTTKDRVIKSLDELQDLININLP